MATTRVEQDGLVVRLGDYEDAPEVFYDKSGAYLVIQTLNASKVKIDAIRATATTLVLLAADAAVATLAAGSITLADATNIVVNATTGTKIGTATTQKLGFYNATPAAQPSAYTQTYATADKTHANPTATNPSAPTAYTAHAAGAVAVTSNASTDLDTTAAALKTLRDEVATYEGTISALIVDVADVKALANSIIDDLQALGLVG